MGWDGIEVLRCSDSDVVLIKLEAYPSSSLTGFAVPFFFFRELVNGQWRIQTFEVEGARATITTQETADSFAGGAVVVVWLRGR